MRKRNAKKIIATVLAGLVLIFLFTLAPIKTQAADILEFKPQVPIPGMSESEPVGTTVGKNSVSTLLPRYIQLLYQYGLSIVSILAAIMLMAGGTLWLVSGGDNGKVSQAKDIISGSLIGMVILFSAYIILNTVNPELLKMKPISLSGIGAPVDIQETRFGCCECEITQALIQKEQMCFSNTGLTPEECETLCETSKKTAQTLARAINPLSIPLITEDHEHKWNYKCGVEADQVNTCIEYKSQESLIFSNNFDPTGWAFDPGIEKQVVDMSPELAQLLNCMRANLPSGAGKISSISDSNYISNLQTCNQTICQGANHKCVHTCASCHYGGGLTTNKSYAVDFGDETNMTALKAAVQKCDNRAYVLDEKNHLHVSSSKCPRD